MDMVLKTISFNLLCESHVSTKYGTYIVAHTHITTHCQIWDALGKYLLVVLHDIAQSSYLVRLLYGPMMHETSRAVAQQRGHHHHVEHGEGSHVQTLSCNDAMMATAPRNCTARRMARPTKNNNSTVSRLNLVPRKQSNDFDHLIGGRRSVFDRFASERYTYGSTYFYHLFPWRKDSTLH